LTDLLPSVEDKGLLEEEFTTTLTHSGEEVQSIGEVETSV